MTLAVGMAIGLFVLLLACLELGRALGRRRRDEDSAGTAAAAGVVFAVLGLLVAFTFTTSASRFDERRQLVVQQANALGTAWLRVDVLPPARQPAIREDMRRWVALAADLTYRSQDPATYKATLKEADRLQSQVWRLGVAAVAETEAPTLNAFVLAPLNDWIDLTTIM